MTPEVVLEEPDCFDPLELDVAVITGDYDDFQDVLQHMGFANYELIDGMVGDEMAGFLNDLDKMLEFDIIIFNGGHVEEGLIYPRRHLRKRMRTPMVVSSSTWMRTPMPTRAPTTRAHPMTAMTTAMTPCARRRRR